jgi:GMP synthase-like glutamine amidotransferase
MTETLKPVAIFRHSPSEDPGYFATFLDAHRIPWILIRIDAGDPLPSDCSCFSGLCFMGGPMSVNDDLPWIPPVLALIREAVMDQRPVIGHCLGGQLMAKALGGTVSRNAVKEIGWGDVCITDPAAHEWLGEVTRFESFHWHGETFTLPPGATRILESTWCPNQGFVMGPHLGMQCHVEMTEELIRTWCKQWDLEKVRPRPSVQTPQQIFENLAQRIEAMHRMADRLYTRWISGLQSDKK